MTMESGKTRGGSTVSKTKPRRGRTQAPHTQPAQQPALRHARMDEALARNTFALRRLPDARWKFFALDRFGDVGAATVDEQTLRNLPKLRVAVMDALTVVLSHVPPQVWFHVALAAMIEASRPFDRLAMLDHAVCFGPGRLR